MAQLKTSVLGISTNANVRIHQTPLNDVLKKVGVPGAEWIIKAWLLVPDVPSQGLVSRVKGVPATISCCWMTALHPLTVDESRDLLAWNWTSL